jgi:hypothetical protein
MNKRTRHLGTGEPKVREILQIVKQWNALVKAFDSMLSDEVVKANNPELYKEYLSNGTD